MTVSASVPLRVCGHAVSPDQATGVARRYGWEVSENANDASVAVIGELGGAYLTQILADSTSLCMEYRVAQDWAPDEGDLSVILSSATAFRVGLPGVFVDALSLRGWIGAKDRADLLLVMNEALANAIIHGNLELDSPNQSSPDLFLHYAAMLEERLAQPQFGGRAVQVSAARRGGMLEIRVRDQGRGFSQRDAEQSLLGRGLRLIREHSAGLRHQDEGRTAIITFSGHGAAQP